MRPKRINVRPGNELEGGGYIVWVYHRKVTIQQRFENEVSVFEGIRQAVANWNYAAYRLTGS